jgi:hypothetical protein
MTTQLWGIHATAASKTRENKKKDATAIITHIPQIDIK